MPEYLSPGVYVEEVDRGPKPIEGVGTAMAAFVGFTEKAEIVRDNGDGPYVEDLLNKPQLVTNWTQFVDKFGGFVPGLKLPLAVYGYFSNGGTRCYVCSVRTFPKAAATLVNASGKPALRAEAKQAGFDAMQLRLRVAGVKGLAAPAAAPAKNAKKDEKAAEEAAEAAAPADSGDVTFDFFVEKKAPNGGWTILESFDGVKLESVAKKVAVAWPNNKAPKFVNVEALETSITAAAPREQEQMLIIDQNLLEAPKASDFNGDVSARTGVDGLEVLDDVTMVVVPDLMTTMPGEKLDLDMVKAVQAQMIAHCERCGDRVAILDTPPNMNPQEVKKWRMETTGFDSSYAAMYYPWIKVSDPATDKIVSVPPSGYVAGVWARNDTTAGVHKAPANEVVSLAVGLDYQTTKGEQDTLNPNGVNCIRSFPGRGIRVWGARTLSSDPAWRYINVRRLYNYVEKSIEHGTQWVVFEPNDRSLWARVDRDITAFLRGVWRDGALFGNTPSEAFYVKVDDELNPPESRDLGRLIIEIGMCPVKPAEFVIFRISQWAGPSAE
ncbi:MAG: phage tail sheath family protein [Flexilinea sp.]|nr:phage tail sheath family protein [Flexilinea sp.]